MRRHLLAKAGFVLLTGSLVVCISDAKSVAPQAGGAINAAVMLAAHNQWRAKVGVPALQWSDKLAATAQQWAAHLAESGCKQMSSGSEYGENLYWASAVKWSDGARQISRKPSNEVVNSWGRQEAQYDYVSNSCSGMCGNYTQIVWKDTRKVGCGMAICGDKGQIWVCKYFPAGNVNNQRPY